MTKNEYNGWTNYETWVVSLWMDNEQPTQEYWAEKAREALLKANDTPSANYRMTGVEPFTVEERAALALDDILKEEHESALPELEGFASDLLSAAMSEVNWHEIATHLVAAAKESLARD